MVCWGLQQRVLWAALFLQVGFNQALLAGSQGKRQHRLCLKCRLVLLVAWRPLVTLLVLQVLCRQPRHMCLLLHGVLRLWVQRLVLLLLWVGLLLWLAGQPLLQLPGILLPCCEHLVKHRHDLFNRRMGVCQRCCQHVCCCICQSIRACWC